jgi:hypothetical protein
MPGYNDDPAKDLRISRLSLISSAARLYAALPPDPDLVLAAAQRWERWVYSTEAITTTNGVVTPVAHCEECDAPLTSVTFKKGNVWTPEYLEAQGKAKYGRVLCKMHYFGKKPV